MKNIIVICLLLTGYVVTAQSIERQVIGSTGGTVAAGSVLITSTIGECAVTTLSGTLTLTQGYQQANDSALVSLSEIAIRATYSLFPNPTSGISTLEITTKKLNTSMNIEVYSLAGKLISTQGILITAGTKSAIELNLTSQANGVYLVTIKEAQAKSSKTIKVIKW